MENKLQKYFDTQMETPEFAEAWKETEASYQAANILLKIRAEKQLNQFHNYLGLQAIDASALSKDAKKEPPHMV